MALSMSVGLRKIKLLLWGNVWPKSMAATAVAIGVRLAGDAQSTTLSSLMLVGVMAFGGALMTRMAVGA